MKKSQNTVSVKRVFMGFGMMFLALFSSCEDLSKINVDPTRATPDKFDPNYFLSNCEWTYLGATMGYNSILLQSGWAQILASTSSGAANYYSNMDKYVPSSNTNEYLASAWGGCYQSATLAKRIITDTEGKTGYDNLRAAAKIMLILSIHYVTDVYGDCPYSEAFKAAFGNNVRPAYDSQQTLYTVLLSELEAAISQLDASKDKLSTDLIYDGDVSKWKKFGNSLMLRMAMRLVKADLGKAKIYAAKAAAAGTFASSDDNAFIKCNFANGYGNAYAGVLLVPSDFYEVRWSKTLMDFLKSAEDPRISVIAEIPKDGKKANEDTKNLTGDNTASKQLGMPNGYDLNGGATDISKSPEYPGGTGSGDDVAPIGKYSRPRMAVYADRNGGVLIYTYAQTELLLAEAAARGFIQGTTAAEHYKKGLVGAMQAMTAINADAAIPAATAAAYADAHPLDVSSTDNSLKMINEQYWATSGCLFSFAEAWSNWRRTDYPKLIPVVYNGNFSSGQIPRRQPYPTTENTSNSASYSAAVANLAGGDKWISRVWWDK